MSKLGLSLHDVQTGWVSSALDGWREPRSSPGSGQVPDVVRSSPAGLSSRVGVLASAPVDPMSDGWSMKAAAAIRPATVLPTLTQRADSATAAIAGPALPAPVAIRRDDWDSLLDAVKWRLRQAVGDLGGDACGASAKDQPSAVRAVVLDCLSALDHLQSSPIEEVDPPARRSGAPLPNHGHFLHRMQQLMAGDQPRRGARPAGRAAGSPFAVLRIDIEGIRALQVAHGRPVVDDLLAVVASRLSLAVRADDLLCRFSGEEYACLPADLPEREQLQRLACKLYDTLAAPISVRKLRLTVQPSLGLAVWPRDGRTAEELLSSADAALQDAKARQAGYAFYEGPGAARAASQQA